MPEDTSIQEIYRSALDSLMVKVRKDQTILAAVLFGSFSYDQVWEKSDIDLWLIDADGSEEGRGYSLMENGVNIHVEVMARNEFKRMLGSSLVTSFVGSSFARSTLLFSRDDSIREWYENVDLHHVGERDREIELLSSGASLLDALMRAEREYIANRDFGYCFHHLMDAVREMARIEVVLHGDVPGREVIQPAVEYNPDLFHPIYTDFIQQPKDEPHVGKVLERVRAYLNDKTPGYFEPVLDYLAEVATARSITEINTFFSKQTRGQRLDGVCDWLARRGILHRLATSVKLTLKSQVEMDQPAYYYDPDTEPVPETIARRTQLKPVYEEALQALTERIQEDHYIVAAFLFGDLACDEIWPGSIIDLVLIHREGVKVEKQYGLIQDGIPVRARLYTRDAYRKQIEGHLQGGFFHTSFLESRLLFSRDSTLEGWYEHAAHMGMRDQETQAMNTAGGIMPILIKAEKWFHVKKDLDYTFVYLLSVVEQLAQLEVICHGEIPGRKPIRRALELNPELFRFIHTDLLHQPKDERKIGQVLIQVNQYLEKQATKLFKPILDYLSEAGGIRTATDIRDRFEKRVQNGWVGMSCEWLASKGVLEQVSSPRKLSRNSRVEVEEVAYYYDDSFPLWE